MAIAASRSWTEALRRLGIRPAGGNHATLQKYASLWSIPTDHFDPDAARTAALRQRPVRPLGVPRPEARRVERPPYDQLMAEIEAAGYSAVGRRYGVSDNAVRKWVRQYRRQGPDEGAAGHGEGSPEPEIAA